MMIRTGLRKCAAIRLILQVMFLMLSNLFIEHKDSLIINNVERHKVNGEYNCRLRIRHKYIKSALENYNLYFELRKDKYLLRLFI